MCTMIYIAADIPILGPAWDDESPAFHVRPVIAAEAELVCRYAARTYVSYVGTREKCGCPFSYGQHDDIDDSPEQLTERADEMVSLRRLIEQVTERSGSDVHIIALEAGEDYRHAGRRHIQAQDLTDNGFYFAPPEVIRCSRAAS